MKYVWILLCCLVGNGLLAKEAVDYVDCFIGTSNSRWMLGPYAQVPFGMVQVGPDNRGNEVNMSAAFIFNYLDRPWLCQRYFRAILERLLRRVALPRLERPRIPFKEIVAGGRLVLQMGKEPNREWF